MDTEMIRTLLKSKVFKISAITFAVVIVVLVGSYFLVNYINGDEPGEDGFVWESHNFVDPVSGVTLSKDNTEDEHTEGPMFLGFGILSDYGVTQRQIDTIRSELTTYAESIEVELERVSLKLDSADFEKINVLTFIVVFNIDQQEIHVRLDSDQSATSGDLTFRDSDGNLLYSNR